ncbi:unnamed protein product [Protopolystoma xenopodis]|uniref:ER membrane protein complex subunit 4 n=1 Tax=Protopolystoma xenopodis TaxID=117903 RepID=A0A3S5CRT7_9PLAT|nr:unnamed protein product [Protopolystoma xenopodis]
MNEILESTSTTLAAPELARVCSRRWTFDLNYRNKSSCNSPDLPHPPGYFERSFPNTTVRNNDPNLTVKRSWDIALGPFRQVPMNFFILWMAGNSISIFPIMMVMMLFFRPIQALLSIHASKLMLYIYISYQCVYCIRTLFN